MPKCPNCGFDHDVPWHKVPTLNQKAVLRMKALISELYALRGEDSETARICKELEKYIGWIE